MLPYGTRVESKNGGSKPPPYDEPFFSADSGFGLLPDRAWTSPRYACPGRERRESGKCDLIYLYFYAIISLKIKAML